VRAIGWIVLGYSSFWPVEAGARVVSLKRLFLTIGSSDRASSSYVEPRRESMIGIKQLRWSSAQPRVAQARSLTAMFLHGIFLCSISAALLGASPMPSPKTQCESLLDAVLPMAAKTLKEHGEFYPFGASLKQGGKVALAMAYDGREKPPSQPLIEMLRDGFRADASAHKIIASAIVYDVRVIPPGTSEKIDAVAVELDHRDNYSVIVFFPYTIRDSAVDIREPFANKGEGRIFTQVGG
jgi:hypothetical protein